MKFHEKVQLLRRARGLTQEALAEGCGVTRQSVAKWEGALALPEPDKLPRLCDLLGVTLDVLLRDDMEPDAAHDVHACGEVLRDDAPGRYVGTLIKESLAQEDLLDALCVHRVELWRTHGSPRYWTALYFTSDAPDLPQRLSRALLPPADGESAWFCDFRAGNTKYIVFRDRVLSYRIGDGSARAQVVRQCEEMGVPAHQTNWED